MLVVVGGGGWNWTALVCEDEMKAARVQGGQRISLGVRSHHEVAASRCKNPQQDVHCTVTRSPRSKEEPCVSFFFWIATANTSAPLPAQVNWALKHAQPLLSISDSLFKTT